MLIPLRNPWPFYAATISPCDADTVAGYTWRVRQNRESGNLYAVSSRGRRDVYMHRLITGCPTGWVVDHINRDTLDNRRENLRITTIGRNGANHDSHGDSIVPFRGVSLAGRQRYRARICVDGCERLIGTYDTAELAAAAYDAAAREAFGPFAWVNLRPAIAPAPPADDVPF